MGVKGVLKNVRRDGVQVTYAMHKIRKLGRTEQARAQKKALDEKIKQSNKVLRARYIKEVFPRVYKHECRKPIQRKVVIMDRGATLSTNFPYLIRYLKAHTNFKIDVHVLKLGHIPTKYYYRKAVRFVRAAATAQAIFVCTANDIMGYFELRPETTYVQLWHGCGAFKRFGLSTIDKKFGKTPASHAEYPVNTNYDYVTISSPEISWLYEEAMAIDKDSGVIAPIGVSRTDVFFDQRYIDQARRKIEQAIPATKDKKIILYAPTFRGQVAKATSPNRLDIALLAHSLGSDYVLIVKHHQVVKTLPAIPEACRDSFAFDMTRGKDIDINELMTLADILITDYSSVAFEYSLFERPMIFFAFDLEDYIDYRGMYYEYGEITPGPVVKTSEEVLDHILHIEDRFDRQEVIDFKNRFMSACDGHSTERIVRLIDDTHQGQARDQ